MGHHGNEVPPELNELLMEELRRAHEEHKFGATGQYPMGKLNQSDEGEIRFGVAHTQDKVILNFGTPVAWIGFDADQADEIARLLTEHAAAIRSK